ncbi:beta-mannosidase-like [Cloeon dipterum]|uniref:beta-mannosidase-like n=1 Tax=Cloeon dipterum TaxID=197152 RepID=UPI00321FCA4C
MKRRDMLLSFGLFFLLFLSFGQTSLIQDLGSEAVEWTFENKNKSVSGKATVPGGIFNDLQKEGILSGQLFYRFGDTENRWVSKDHWTFRTNFKVSSGISDKEKINLITDGLNTVATVTLNGVKLCGCKNMFTRFVFPVEKILKKDGSPNILEVAFESTIKYAANKFEENPVYPRCVPEYFNGECHVNMVRTMQASFGWDWGPALPSQGIWKNVRLEGYDSITIRDVKYFVEREQHSWKVNVIAFLELQHNQTKEVDVYINLASNQRNVFQHTEPVKIIEINKEPTISSSFSVSEESVELWWPNGMNKSQPLYNIIIALSKNDQILASKTNRIGFRTIKLIQVPVVKGDSSKGLTFHIEVNGYPIFSKGSNYVPGNIIPEKGTDPKLAEHLLRSSAEAGYNMLRVWGGGVYETDYFYDLCDELGIMIWQDFMFANSLYPVDDDFLGEVQREVTGTVRRLQHHACIVIWAGNNEMEGAVQDSWWDSSEQAKKNYIKLFGHVIRDLVLEEDLVTPFVVSSPTNGLKTINDGYLPQESAWSGIFGDTHVYKYGYNEDLMESGIYDIARFVSEYGYQSFPFLSNWRKETIEEDLNDFNSKFISRRQHQAGGTQRVFTQTSTILMPKSSESKYREAKNLDKFIFLSQISQSIGTGFEALKHRRLRNFFNASSGQGLTMGSMYWQLNDVWAAPSWGGIDHEGKWKMLHYHMSKIFAPVAISVDDERGFDHISVYAVSDLLEDLQNVELEVKAYNWGSLEIVKIKKINIGILGNLSAAVVLEGDVKHLLQIDSKLENTFLTLQLKENDGKALTEPYFHPLQTLNSVNFSTIPDLKILEVVKKNMANDPYYKSFFEIEISTNKPAPYVWLDAREIRGRFSENGFVFTNATYKVEFLALEETDETELKKALTIQSYFDAITML